MKSRTGVVAKSFAPQHRPLQRDLAEAADNRADRDADNRRQAEARHHRHEANAHRIVATLNIAGDNAGMKNRRSEFSMPIIATRDGDGREKRQHDARQLGRQLELARDVSANHGAMACVIGEAKTIPISDEHAGDQEERVDDEIAEPPRRVAALASSACG